MKTKLTLIAAGIFAMNMAFAQVQQEGEPVKAADEVPLGGFEGCSLAPPKDGCDARVKCNGVGRIIGSSPYAVQDATKEAQMRARAELAKFYNEKVKAKEAVATASEASQKTGEADKESFSRFQASVVTSKAEEVLQGFQVLGRQVDMTQKTVTIKGGVSCRSKAAAGQLRSSGGGASAPQAAAGAPAAPQGGLNANGPGGGYSAGPGNLKSMNQKSKNADNF